MSEGEHGRPCIKWRRKEIGKLSKEKAEELYISCLRGRMGDPGNHCGYKYYAWTVSTSVFKLTLRMQTWVQILITACILSMVSLVPTLMKKEKRSSKYKAQLFDPGFADT